jgi:DivIVA domain-containing protein
MPLTPADIHNMAFRKSSLGRRGYDAEEVDAFLDAATQEMIQLLEENDAMRDYVRRADAVAAREMTPDSVGEMELSTVFAVLDQARRGCDRAEQEAQALRSRLDDARRAAGGEVSAAPAGADTERALAMAHRTAEQHLQGAYREAHQLVIEARERSERVVQQARLTARGIAEDARRRDDEAVVELRDRHTALLREIEELAGFAKTYRAALKDHIRRQEVS